MTIPKQSLIFDSDIIEPTEVGHTTTTCEIYRQCRAKITFFAIDMNIMVMIFLYGSKYVRTSYLSNHTPNTFSEGTAGTGLAQNGSGLRMNQ